MQMIKQRQFSATVHCLVLTYRGFCLLPYVINSSLFCSKYISYHNCIEDLPPLIEEKLLKWAFMYSANICTHFQLRLPGSKVVLRANGNIFYFNCTGGRPFPFRIHYLTKQATFILIIYRKFKTLFFRSIKKR